MVFANLSHGDLFLSTSPLISMYGSDEKPFAKVLGIPFDSTSTYRMGSRFGPDSIRQAFANIEIYSRGLDIDLEQLSFQDLGNLAETGSVDVMQDSTEKIFREIASEGLVTGILGGEHSITYGSLKALPHDVGILIFDAHFDLREEYADLRMSHATYLRRYIEENGSDHIIHVGARAATKAEWGFAEESQLKIISDNIINVDGDLSYVLKTSIQNFNKVYVSIDLDVLDPAYAPGVGNPEASGLSTHELLELIYLLKGKDIIGFDITELSPSHDNGSTSIVAAKCLSELLCLSYLGRND